MWRKWTTAVLAALAVSGLSAVAATSPALAADDSPFSGLSVLADPQVHVLSRDRADYLFHRVSLLDVPLVRHTFLLRNDGASPVTIAELQPSCHCTSAIVVALPGAVPPATGGALPTLAPGQEVAIEMTVTLPGHPPGPFSKSIFVCVEGRSSAAACLEAVGYLDTGVTVTPQALDFGALKPDEVRSRTITMTADPRLTAQNALPPLISGRPDIQVRPQKSVGPNPSTVTYIVTVRAPHAGTLEGGLSFARLPATYRSGSLSIDTVTSAFESVAVPITGHVKK